MALGKKKCGDGKNGVSNGAGKKLNPVFGAGKGGGKKKPLITEMRLLFLPRKLGLLWTFPPFFQRQKNSVCGV